MKGIVLAGGTGSRLYPLTKIMNKHLIPVYNEPMIYLPLKTLINAGIEDIMIVSGKGYCGQFLELLEDGSNFNIHLSYMVQTEPRGIAQALGLCRRFIKNDNMAVILGDNIFENIFNFDNFRDGAKIFLKEVSDAYRFGVAEIKDDRIVSIIEKPNVPSSNLAVTGLYLYDSRVFKIIDTIEPSNRGELEITDVNNICIKEGKMQYQIIDGFWSDAGTFESLFRSSSFIRSMNKYKI